MKKTFITLILSSVFSIPFFSQSGKYIEFDGVKRHMTIPNHKDFNISNSESFTVTCWINILEYKNNARFISKRCMNAIDNKSGYELWGSVSDNKYYATNTPNTDGNHNNSLSKWPNYTGSTNKWTHISFVVDRVVGKMYQYIDGVEVINSGTKDISPWFVNNTFDVHIGCGFSGNNLVPVYFFKGRMDNLRFYKKALSAEEMKADMTSSVTVATPGLIAAYDFEDIEGTTVSDITGNHTATLVNFPTIGEIAITNANVVQDENFAGRGNKNEEILKLIFSTNGNIETAINNVVIKMTGTTDINEIENIKLYTTANNDKFDPRNPVAKGAKLLGTATVLSGKIILNTTGNLVEGTNYLWLTYDIKETAKEGNKIDAEVLSVTTTKETYTISNGNPSGNREILLSRTLVFAPGDYGSKNYRIPAISTLDDSTLVTITDKRKNNPWDLPQDIDIVCRRSIDNGRTWSEPIVVAQGQGNGKGYGDGCIIKTQSGKLILLFVGGRQFQGSTADDPIRSYMSTSIDGGLTWTAPKDLTNQLYGSNCTDPVRKYWQGSFFGSGRGLTMKNGRIMAVMTVKPQSGSYQNYAIYSDDEGNKWQVSDKAIDGGDEAKVIELNDGTILMSSRTQGNRLYAKSTDGGINWGTKESWSEMSGNACNADIIRYTSTKDNYDKDRILHTLPNASDRRNVTMWISYDEAKTWPVKKTLCAGTSAYSSITILQDGTIGVYLEEDKTIPYKMYFLNFSLNWLTGGKDTYKIANAKLVETPVISPKAGKYAEPQNITITCVTENAKIYYTIDGSTPNIQSTEYTAPFKIDKTGIVKAIAVKKGLANSEIAISDYTIENGSSTAIENVLLGNIGIYPNPVKDILKISFTESKKYIVTLFSIDGRLLEQQYINGNKTIFNLSNYIANVYLLNIKDDTGNKVTLRVLKD